MHILVLLPMVDVTLTVSMGFRQMFPVHIIRQVGICVCRRRNRSFMRSNTKVKKPLNSHQHKFLPFLLVASLSQGLPWNLAQSNASQSGNDDLPAYRTNTSTSNRHRFRPCTRSLLRLKHCCNGVTQVLQGASHSSSSELVSAWQ